MHSTTAFELLSFFTTRERADSIVGDLVEESRDGGKLVYWLRVLGVAVALSFERFRLAPAQCIGLAALGLTAHGCVLTLVFVASGLPWYPWNHAFAPGFWARLVVVVLSANLLTGYVLGRWVALQGANPIAGLVPLWLVAWPISVGIKAALFPGAPFTWLAGALAFPLFGLLPLIAGAIIARRREARPMPPAGG